MTSSLAYHNLHHNPHMFVLTEQSPETCVFCQPHFQTLRHQQHISNFIAKVHAHCPREKSTAMTPSNHLSTLNNVSPVSWLTMGRHLYHTEACLDLWLYHLDGAFRVVFGTPMIRDLLFFRLPTSPYVQHFDLAAHCPQDKTDSYLLSTYGNVVYQCLARFSHAELEVDFQQSKCYQFSTTFLQYGFLYPNELGETFGPRQTTIVLDTHFYGQTRIEKQVVSSFEVVW